MKKYQEIKLKLESKGIQFQQGMSPEEITDAEELFGISFPVELKRFYSVGLPVSKGFYNWRDKSEENIQCIKSVLDGPLHGLIFDLENNDDFWCDDWGDKPKDINDAKRILIERYSNAPKMIPVFGHRYIPYIPNVNSFPVFSICQSDIIIYGKDLISYLEIEFGFRPYDEMLLESCPNIDFWSSLYFLNNRDEEL